MYTLQELLMVCTCSVYWLITSLYKNVCNSSCILPKTVDTYPFRQPGQLTLSDNLVSYDLCIMLEPCSVCRCSV